MKKHFFLSAVALPLIIHCQNLTTDYQKISSRIRGMQIVDFEKIRKANRAKAIARYKFDNEVDSVPEDELEELKGLYDLKKQPWDEKYFKRINHILKVFDDYLKKESKINGKAGFSFGGSQNSDENLYRIGVNGSMDYRTYPYEIDFSVNIQATSQNGVFEEDLSDVDVSLDCKHPSNYVCSL